MARSSDGVDIAYETHGSAGDSPSVVLVHGWSCDRGYWAGQIDFLAARHQVIAVDLGGHGESGIGRADWTLEAFGDDVVAAVRDAGATSVVLVGHSMGGDAIVRAAPQLDDAVVGIVFVDAFRSLADEVPASPEQIDAFLAPFRDDFHASVDQFVRDLFPATADPDLVDCVAADMAAAPREVALGSLRYAPNRQAPMVAALAQVSAPCVAINPGYSPTDVESLLRHGVETVIVADTGHFLMMEAPDRFNAALGDVLARFTS